MLAAQPLPRPARQQPLLCSPSKKKHGCAVPQNAWRNQSFECDRLPFKCVMQPYGPYGRLFRAALEPAGQQEVPAWPGGRAGCCTAHAAGRGEPLSFAAHTYCPAETQVQPTVNTYADDRLPQAGRRLGPQALASGAQRVLRLAGHCQRAGTAHQQLAIGCRRVVRGLAGTR